MPFEPLANTLQRFPVFRTSNPEEFRHALLTRYGATSAEIKSSEGLTARGSLVQLQSIGLIYGQGSTAARADFPETDRFRLFSALTGKGHTTIGKQAIALDADQCCIVSPGLIDTPFHAGNERAIRQRVSSIPLGRMGEPEEVARMVGFLVSERASYVTGQVWTVAGGR